MTAIEFYRFINDNSIEWHWHLNDGKQDVLIFPNYDEIKEFRKILQYEDLEEDGIECIMKDGYFAIWMNDLLESWGIDIYDIFEHDGNKC